LHSAIVFFTVYYRWRSFIMSASLHPTEIHHRQHRKEKRNKLRAKLAAASAVARPAIEAKLKKTYAHLPDAPTPKSDVEPPK
jgi:hypothetical protein